MCNILCALNGVVLLHDRQKIGTAIVHYYFFLPGVAAWQTICVRHSGKTRFDPQMDVGPYA